MAWPVTPAETVLANVTTVKADLAMAIQRSINGLYGGSITVRSVVIDGSGGSGYAGPNSAPTGTSTAGTAKVSAAGSRTTAGALAVPLGTIYKGSVPIGWAHIQSDGTILRGLNVFTAPGLLDVANTRHQVAGVYTVTFDVAVADELNCVAIATAFSDGDGLSWNVTTKSGVDGGKVSVQVVTFNAAGTTADHRFQVVLFGE